MKQLIVIQLFIVIFTTVNAQSNLENTNQTPEVLNSSAVHLWEKGMYHEALNTINLAYKKAVILNDSVLMARTLNNTGLIYSSLGEPATSRFYYEQSVEILRKINNKKELMNAFLNIGIAYKENAYYDKALEYLFEAASLFETEKDSIRLSSAYNTIGNIFQNLNEYNKSLNYHFIALNLRKKTNYIKGIAGSYNNIGTVYELMGKYDSAISYFNKSLSLKSNINKPELTANSMSHLGDIYLLTNQLALAQKYYLESFQIRSDANIKSGLAYAHYDLGKLYFKLHKNNLAKNHLSKSIEMCDSLELPGLALKSYSTLKDIFKSEKNFPKALYYFELYSELKEQVLNIEIQKHLNQTEIKYETEKKKRLIRDLNIENEKREAINLQQTLQLKINRSNNRTLIIVCILLTLIIMMLVVLVRQRVKFSQKLDMTMRELHHRVKNNLQILQSLSNLQLENIKDEEAKKIIESNSSRINAMILIHRDLYFDQNITKVNIPKYIRVLVSNLMTAFNKNRKQIKVNYSMDESIDISVDKAITLGLLLNELVTNSFKYAFIESNPNPELNIQFQNAENGHYQLIVSDNGPGLNEDKNKKSIGLKLVDSQIRQLKGSMKIESNNGLKYQFHF
jgi:two-component system, sensor histidine kinase PdtaS